MAKTKTKGNKRCYVEEMINGVELDSLDFLIKREFVNRYRRITEAAKRLRDVGDRFIATKEEWSEFWAAVRLLNPETSHAEQDNHGHPPITVEM